MLECLHPESGARYWEQRSPTRYEDDFGYGAGPRCTPVVSAGRVLALGAEGRLRCLHLETGTLLWQRDLAAEFALEKPFFGFGSTPLLLEDRIVMALGAPDGPSVAAFALADGRLLWGAGKQWFGDYASPIRATLHGRERILVFGGGKSRPPVGGLTVVDLQSGRLEWEFPWRSRTYYSVNGSTPLAVGNQVLLSESYGLGAVLLDLAEDGSGKVAWTCPEFDLHFATPLVKDGHLFGIAGQKQGSAQLCCVRLADGKVVWRDPLQWEEEVATRSGKRTRSTGAGRAFLLDTPQGVLCLGEEGHLLWLELGPEGCTVRQRFRPFLAPQSWTPLVLSHGLLWVLQNDRDLLSGTDPRILCFDLRG